MPIFLKNLQRAVLLNEHLLHFHCTFLLNAARAEKFDVSIACVDNREIRNLNRIYRNVNATTDVLSFPYHEVATPGTLPSPAAPSDYNLGDIVLGMPLIAAQCAADRTNLVDRLTVLVTHALCHLMGHTHHTRATCNAMFQDEAQLLTVFNTTFGTQLKPLTVVVKQ